MFINLCLQTIMSIFGKGSSSIIIIHILKEYGWRLCVQIIRSAVNQPIIHRRRRSVRLSVRLCPDNRS